MANQCAIYNPGMATSAWSGAWGTQTVTIGGKVYQSLYDFSVAAGAAQSANNIFYFDADTWNIVCTSFPEAGSSGNGLTFVALQAVNEQQSAAIANLQSQVTAITPWAAASDAGGYMTSELHVEYFGAVVAFLAVIWLADRVRRFFWREGGEHV